MKRLSKNLFWDTEFKNINLKKHTDFIIKRVLQYGDIEDYKFIKEKYGIKKIKEVAKKTSFIDKKSPNFWKLVFNT